MQQMCLDRNPRTGVCRTSAVVQSGDVTGVQWGRGRDHAHSPWALTGCFQRLNGMDQEEGCCPELQVFVAFQSMVPCPWCGTCMPPVLAGQLQGTCSSPVRSPASRKRCQHIHGVRPGNEVHFPTQVVTCGSGAATVGSAANTGAVFGVSRSRLCVLRAVHREPHLLSGQYWRVWC